MGGRERTYRPRARTTRPLGRHGPQTHPSKPADPPSKVEGGWFVSEPLAHRLHQKSALGQRVEGGLCSRPKKCCSATGTVIFLCQPMVGSRPHSRMTQLLLRRTIALDVLRNGGERVVPVVHLASRYDSLPPATWAIRWERQEAWTAHPGHTQVRIQRTHDPLDWDELGRWVSDVHDCGHVAELCVIDDEFDTTVYHLSFMEPRGSHQHAGEPSDDVREQVARGALPAHRWTVVSFFPLVVNGRCRVGRASFFRSLSADRRA